MPRQQLQNPAVRPRTAGRRPFTSFVDNLEARRLMAAISSSVNFADKHQTIDGFGAAIMTDESLPEYYTKQFFDTIVGDLGTSLVRTSLRPTFEGTNDNSDPNVFNWAAYDQNSIKQTMNYLQRFKERGMSNFMLTCWTPPWWQKTNLTLHEGGMLRDDMYQEFAETVAAYLIVAQRDYGITFKAVSLQNEQNFIEGYISAYYDPVQLRELYRVTAAKLQREGLGNVKLIYNEDVGSDQPRWQWYNGTAQQDPELKDANIIWGSHYTPPVVMANQWNSIKDSGHPLWYTELSGKSSTWDAGVRTAIELADALNVGNISAQLYWQFSYRLTRPGDITSNTAALMTDGTPNPKYFAMKHFYKYVRPGSQRVTTTGSTDLVKFNAFRQDSTNANTIIITNNDRANDQTVTLNLAGGSLPANWRVFVSTENNYWQQRANVVGGSKLTLTVPKFSMVTLYAGPDITMSPGIAATKLDTTPYDDASRQFNTIWNWSIISNMDVLPSVVTTANVNNPSWDNWTALHAAAAGPWERAEATVKFLLSKGANVNAKTTRDGFTPLHTLAMNPMMRWRTTSIDAQTAGKATALINAGANVNALDKYGRTPLMYAAMYPKNRLTVPDASLVATLLARGANKNIKDVYGKTAYDYAIQWGQEEAAALLLGPDTQKPVVRYGAYKPDRNSVELAITENVTGSFDSSDLVLTNLTTARSVASSTWTLAEDWRTGTYNTGLTVAKLTFSSILPDGKYRLSIPAGRFTDGAGNANAAYTLEFAVMKGDVNADGQVNFIDLQTLANNFGQSGKRFSDGDLNRDGSVGFSDLLVLASQYGQRLLNQAAPPPPTWFTQPPTKSGGGAGDVLA
jgi:O-glycosyl hydrolase